MKDQLAVIKIEGMHCHKCEQAIQRALLRNPGVHEVEVDFNSKQASVLFNRAAVTVGQLMEAVNSGLLVVSEKTVCAVSPEDSPAAVSTKEDPAASLSMVHEV